MKHVILTRFSVLPTADSPPHPGDWLRHRLELFESYCAPSIASQTCPDFEWFVFCDRTTAPWCIDRLGELAAEIGQLQVALTTPREPSTELALAEVRDSEEVLLTTRIDSDDCTSRDFVERAQAYGPPFSASGHAAALVSFSRGFKLREEDGKLFEIWNPHSAHLSLFERLDGGARPRTVQSGNHGYMQEQYPLTVDAAEPTWIQIVHGGNVSNRVLKADPEVPRSRLADRFAIRARNPGEPVLPPQPEDELGRAEYRQALEEALLGPAETDADPGT